MTYDIFLWWDLVSQWDKLLLQWHICMMRFCSTLTFLFLFDSGHNHSAERTWTNLPPLQRISPLHYGKLVISPPPSHHLLLFYHRLSHQWVVHHRLSSKNPPSGSSGVRLRAGDDASGSERFLERRCFFPSTRGRRRGLDDGAPPAEGVGVGYGRAEEARRSPRERWGVWKRPRRSSWWRQGEGLSHLGCGEKRRGRGGRRRNSRSAAAFSELCMFVLLNWRDRVIGKPEHNFGYLHSFLIPCWWFPTTNEYTMWEWEWEHQTLSMPLKKYISCPCFLVYDFVKDFV